MPVSREDILVAIESAMLVPQEYPEDLIRWLDIAGVRGQYSADCPYAPTNAVGCARLTEENVEVTIDVIIAHYESLDVSFSWNWSSNSTPDDLGERLEKRGFEKVIACAGMALTGLNHSIEVNPAVTVRVAEESDTEQMLKIYQDGFRMPGCVDRVFLSMLEILNGRNYLAFIEGKSDPVGFANMFYYPGKPIAVLQGAATLEAYQGQGIYSALMARRLDDARADGIEVAVLQADLTTSAPICEKSGFEKWIDTAFYVYPVDGD